MFMLEADRFLLEQRAAIWLRATKQSPVAYALSFVTCEASLGGLNGYEALESVPRRFLKLAHAERRLTAAGIQAMVVGEW